jgi:hypothetical protein
MRVRLEANALRFSTRTQCVMRNELRNLAAHACAHFVRITPMDSGIDASVDYFLNTFTKTIPVTRDA